MYSLHSCITWRGPSWPKNVVKCTKCVKKILLWLIFHFSVPDLPDCTMPRPRRWLCAYAVVYLHKLYVCNQCFWLRGVCVWEVPLVVIMRREEDTEIGADPAFTKNKMWHFTELRVLCTACKNSLRIGEIVCLCMYIWMDWWMCVSVYLCKTIYIFQWENLVYMDVIQY
jgi:hypothetical protein